MAEHKKYKKYWIIFEFGKINIYNVFSFKMQQKKARFGCDSHILYSLQSESIMCYIQVAF